MERRNSRKWFNIYLIVFIVVPILLTSLHTLFFGCRGLCGIGTNYMSWVGLGLTGFGLVLPFLSYKYRQHSQRFDRIQDWLFTFVCLVVGTIVFFQSWRQGPALQMGQFLLSEAIVYFAIKDIFDR